MHYLMMKGSIFHKNIRIRNTYLPNNSASEADELMRSWGIRYPTQRLQRCCSGDGWQSHHAGNHRGHSCPAQHYQSPGSDWHRNDISSNDAKRTSSTHRILNKITSRETHNKKFKRKEIMLSMLSDQNRIKLKINKLPNIYR